jgi:hypothetical protein
MKVKSRLTLWGAPLGVAELPAVAQFENAAMVSAAGTLAVSHPSIVAYATGVRIVVQPQAFRGLPLV